MEKELKCCPFCGSESEFFCSHWLGGAIRCTNKCASLFYNERGLSKEEAIAVWNKRIYSENDRRD